MIDFFQFCCNWWSQGGVVNYFLLASAGAIGFMMYHSKYSQAFINGMIGILPSIGLLGTVIGMIECFTVLSQSAADVGGMSAAISKALITTEVGLAIAISGTMLLFWKNKRDGTHIGIQENIDLRFKEKMNKDLEFQAWTHSI